MYSIKTTEDYLYNHYNTIAAKIFNKTVFGGKHTVMEPNSSYFEIWLMKSLFCELRTENKVFRLREGDVLIFSAEDKKSIVQADQNSNFLVLQIEPASFLEMLPKSDITANTAFLRFHSNKFDNKLSAFAPVTKNIVIQLLKTERIFSEKAFGYEFSAASCIVNLINTIISDTDYYSNSPETSGDKKNSKQHRSLKNVIDYIDTHLNEELTLDKIAAVSKLSPNYLSNIFRSYTGVKLWDYICEKRIILATKLLIENPGDSILTIALKCGYNNCPNFNRAFKKYTGQTPKQYKTSILRQEAQNEK